MKYLICKIAVVYLAAITIVQSPVASAVAEEALSTEELREIQTKMSGRPDMSVDFVQIRTSALRPKKPSRSSGKALFAKPSRFRWELEKPQADVLIFDGKNIFSYKPGESTATRFKTEGDKAQEIKEVIDFVMDFDALLKRYQLVSSTRRGNEILLELKPKSDGPMKTIEILVDAKNYFVQSLKMNFSNKNTSEFQFSNPAPATVTAKSFSVPDNMKIIEGL